MGSSVSVVQKNNFEGLRRRLVICCDLKKEHDEDDMMELVRGLHDSGIAHSVAVIRNKLDELVLLDRSDGDASPGHSPGLMTLSGLGVLPAVHDLRLFLRDELCKKYLDLDFPPLPCSVGITPKCDVSWHRLHTFNDHCIFPPGEPSSNSVIQSNHLGNCYFITALSVLAEYPAYIHRLFGSSTHTEGCHCLNLHHDGEWHQVIVDDFLPVCSSSLSKNPPTLLFGKNRSNCGFWAAVLEKAYAKLFGSYAAINGGDIAEGLRDLSGSPVFSLRLNHGVGLSMTKNGKLWEYMNEKLAQGNLLACGWCGNATDTEKYLQRQHKDKGAPSEKSSNVLVPNHAYSILKCVQKSGRRKIQIRNPWGRSINVEDVRNEECGGSMWLDYDVWSKSANALYTCILHHSRLLQNNPSILESPSLFRICGQWCAGNAGGCSEFSSWRKNPQFYLCLHEAGTIYLTLSQPDKRKTRGKLPTTEGFEDLNYNQIGIEVIQVHPNNANVELLAGKYSILAKSAFWNKRDVSLELQISRDITNSLIIVVPSTYYPNQEGSFIISAEMNHEGTACLSAPKAFTFMERKVGEKGSASPEVCAQRVEKVHEISYFTGSAFSYSYNVKDEWTKKNCGGVPHSTHFYMNPQYQARVTCPTEIVFFVRQQSEYSKPCDKNTKRNATKTPVRGIGASCYRNVECLENGRDVEILCFGQRPIGKPELSTAIEISKYIVVDPTYNPILFVPCIKKGDCCSFEVEVLSTSPIYFEKAPKSASKEQRHAVSEEVAQADHTEKINLNRSKKSVNISTTNKHLKKPNGSMNNRVSFEKAKLNITSLCNDYSDL